MNKNVIIILVGGFLVAILVAVIVQSALTGSKKKEITSDDLTQILVATKSLAVGREIRSGDLKWQDWPKANVFPGAVMRDGEQQPTEAAEGKLIRSMAKGEALHMSLLVKEDKGDFLSANVRKGMRAVGVSVRREVLADRLIRPGDFVDVMVTYRVRVNTRKNPEAQALVSRYASETVIENVRILAVDKNDTKAVDEEDTGGAKKKKKSSKKAVVTIEVQPEDAEKLVLANKMGSIGLALRSIGDDSDVGTDRTTTDVGMSRVMTNLSNMKGTTSGVRIYDGDNVREVRARTQKDPSTGASFDVEEPINTDEEKGATATVTFGPGALEQILESE